MGTSKADEVFDIEAHAEPARPEDEILAVIKRQMDSDRWFAEALWYARGRMWYEPAPLMDEDGGNDEQGSAMGFALQYQSMMHAFRERQRSEVVPMDRAWANYVKNVGGTIED